MSRRDDYLMALTCVLQKDRDVTAGQAAQVLELAMGLPHDSFPSVTSADLRQLVEHAIEPWSRGAPSWLVEVRENAKVERDTVLVCCIDGGAQPEWYANANSLWRDGDTPESATRLIMEGKTSVMSREDFDALLRWVSGIPGDADACPFAIAEDEEERR